MTLLLQCGSSLLGLVKLANGSTIGHSEKVFDTNVSCGFTSWLRVPLRVLQGGPGVPTVFFGAIAVF